MGKKILTETEKQDRAAKARESRRQRKLAAEQQHEHRALLFNDLSEEECEQIVSGLQEILNEYNRLFEEFVDERDMKITHALRLAVEKHGDHHVLAALESGAMANVYSAIRRDLAKIVIEDFENTHGRELDAIDEIEGRSESAAEALVNIFGGRFDEQGNYIPQVGANC